MAVKKNDKEVVVEAIPPKAKEASEDRPKAIKKAPYYVYIGPSIRGSISANAVLTQDDLTEIKDVLERHPDINTLLIPGDKLGEARAAMKRQDSYLRAVYSRLANKA